MINKAKVKFGIKKLLIITTALTLCCSFILGYGGYNPKADDIKDSEDKISELEKKEEEAKKILEELEKEKGDIEKYVEKLDVQVSQLSKEINELSEEITQCENDIETTKAEIKKAQAEEDAQYAAMVKRIQYTYENGNDNYIDIILGSESLVELINNVEYVEKISEYDRNILKGYQKAKDKVIVKEAQLENQLATLNDKQAQVKLEKETVEKLVSDKEKEILAYEKKIAKNEDMLSDYVSLKQQEEENLERLLEEERQRILEEERKRKEEEERKRKEEEERKRREEEERKRKEEEEKKKQEELAGNSGNKDESDNNSDSDETEDDKNQPEDNKDDNQSQDSENTIKEDYLWPCPDSSRITSVFGYRKPPTAGASSYHMGIDVGAPSGARIVATKSGTVSSVYVSRASGNSVVIYHGDGVFTYYFHCSTILVESGQSVKQGEVIALVGSTGYSTGPHLDFRININGEYKDPLKYVSP